MQEFTKEYKALQEGLHKCWDERASKEDELNKLQVSSKKIFGDFYLGLVPLSKKDIIIKKIRGLKEDISSIGIAIEELELRHMLLKRSGSHIQEVKED